MVVTGSGRGRVSGDTPTRIGEPGAGGTRRQVARGLLGAGLAVVLAPAVAACGSGATADRAGRHHGEDGRPGGPPPGDASDQVVFDEVYRGRRLRGIRSTTDRAADGAGGEGTWRVTVDDRPLHLMRRADGTWLTMVDHYASYPTPLAAARAAVDELGPGRRLLDPGAGHASGGGSDRGVHA
ncbi:tyrosinase family oxidase copper chaperone [Streptomyces sp. NPDC029526]|uniref:tyrosinase family oxidase copper chaperone n=1 Tax=Streptomyces sp. NPDC029526 TaxID=3155728 RepID=UPI0033F9F1B7